MNAEQLTTTHKAARSEPLFASTWVALFLVIRRGLMNPRDGG